MSDDRQGHGCVEPDTSAAFFEQLYRNGDPWNFDSDSYEQDRYAQLLGALDGRRFRRAYEPACAMGALTRRLADQCDELIARDLSPSAVACAQLACSELQSVDVSVGDVREDPPSGSFDLVVFSELGYYFELPELTTVVDKIVDLLVPGGVTAGTHWTGSSPDHRIAGEVVVATIDRHPELEGWQSVHDGYILGCWTKTDGAAG
jgi:trans-aconitate methyltransferase